MTHPRLICPYCSTHVRPGPDGAFVVDDAGGMYCDPVPPGDDRIFPLHGGVPADAIAEGR